MSVGPREANIEIGDYVLSEGQSMAVRVAITNFLTQLDDPEYSKALGPVANGYRDRLREVIRAMAQHGGLR